MKPWDASQKVDGLTDRQKNDLRRRLGRENFTGSLDDILEGIDRVVAETIHYTRWRQRGDLILVADKNGHVAEGELTPDAKAFASLGDALRRFADIYASQTTTAQVLLDQVVGVPNFGRVLRDRAEKLEQIFPKKRRHGRPSLEVRHGVALKVGTILLLAGVRSMKAPIAGPLGGRDGIFADILRVVFDAIGLPVPEDMFTVIAKTSSDLRHLERHLSQG